MSFWIDTHCHMNEDIYQDDLDSFLMHAKENNVLESIWVCCNYESYQRTLMLKEKYPNIKIALGYHPEDANNDNDLSLLEEALKEKRLIALGEIGLDYYWVKDNKNKQKELFIKQIELANQYQVPILIHSRDASKDTYDILKQYAQTKVLMHCFSDSLEMMKEYLKLGYYIAFGGVVTFKNSKQPKENALNCPIDKLMIETDCPYMTPVPFRGQTNETAYVRYVGEYISQLKGIGNEQLQAQLMKNFETFFGVENED